MYIYIQAPGYILYNRQLPVLPHCFLPCSSPKAKPLNRASKVKSKLRTPPRDVGSQSSSFVSSFSSQRSPQPITDETAIAGELASTTCNREIERVSNKSEQCNCKNHATGRPSDCLNNSTACNSLQEPIEALSCSHLTQNRCTRVHRGILTSERCLHSSTSCSTSTTTCTHSYSVARPYSNSQVLIDSEFILDGKPVT